MGLRHILTQHLRHAVDAAAALMLRGGATVAPFLLRVPGYLYPHEAVFLYWLAREGPGDGDLVEIGSFHGRSTLCLAAGLRDRGSCDPGRLVAVDPHVYASGGSLHRNVRRFHLEDRVDILTIPSCEAAAARHRPVRLLFIDGDHTEAAVRADLAAWHMHLTPGGILVLHDSTSLSGLPGPRALATEILADRVAWDRAGTLGSITWARRRPGHGWTPRTGGVWMDRLLRRLRRPLKTA
jgi:predicted O-methyltransferase YrrM